jgi:hypothetical protein
MVLAWRANTKDGLAADTKDVFYSSDPGWGGVANAEVGEEDRWGWGVVHSFYRVGDGGNITSLGGKSMVVKGQVVRHGDGGFTTSLSSGCDRVRGWNYWSGGDHLRS